jgi:hypothetical protein
MQLPGQRARQFRASGMDVLMRFLAGDPSLHNELDNNAARQVNLPEQHPMQMLSEEIYAHPRSSKYVIHSPNMQGKYIGSFYNKAVVYILQVPYEGKSYIKIGWSDEFRGRMDSHFIELPGCNIWSIHAIDNAYRVEQAWKDDFRAHCAPIVINGKQKTELYLGISTEEAEARLSELCHVQRMNTDRHHEYEMMKLKHEQERERMAHELKMKQLELDILHAQLKLK